jgi:putative membrane protein insertion efficiency factor
MSAVDVVSTSDSAAPATRSASSRRGPVGAMLVWLIRIYQAARVGHVSPCRFSPTCSHYAVDAIELHGARRGLGLTVRRLLRCRPGGPSGFDPVPIPGHDADPRLPDSPTGAM